MMSLSLAVGTMTKPILTPKRLLDDWEFSFDLDETNHKMSVEIANQRITIYEDEVRQYKAGQRHLRTHCRRTLYFQYLV